MPSSTEIPNRGFSPARPDLVMIWITPFDASVPYRVAAAGPLIISILSMLSGSMSLIRDTIPELNPCTVTPAPWPLLIRTPST